MKLSPKAISPMPIFMYHKVGEPVLSKQDRFLNVETRDFQRQMLVLTRLGYRGKTFADVTEAIVTNKSLGTRVFAVTFDDGYANVGRNAAPVLRSLQIPATVFAVSEYVGDVNAWDRLEGRSVLPLMGWEALRALQSEGWEIAGHTMTHPHLDALDDAEALRQIRGGREAIADALGVAPTTFCYPFGHLNSRTPNLVREAGFLSACTVRRGIATNIHDPYLLPRVKVAYRDRVAGMLYRLLVAPHLPDMRRKRRSSSPSF